jgi:hypothetical protein
MKGIGLKAEEISAGWRRDKLTGMPHSCLSLGFTSAIATEGTEVAFSGRVERGRSGGRERGQN